MAVLLIEFWFAFLFGLVVVAASDSGTGVDFQGCQHQLKNHLSRSPFSHHQDAVCRVFYFNFLLQVKQKSSHGWLQPFSRATRGINQEGEEGRKQLHNCHLRFLSLGSHDLFSLTSAHLPALWPVYFYCQVSLFLSDAVSVSISSMMYYKQAVSSLIHTHTPVVSRYISPSSSTRPKT